jgi:regulator of ribonuclease activity A
VEFTTADLCDSFPQLVRLVAPLFREYGDSERFAGPIETLKVFEDNSLVRQALATEGRGRVLVVDGGGSLRCALVGGRLAALGRDTGWSGLLINGCVRDSAELRRIRVGVRALNTAPLASRKSGEGQLGVEVTFAEASFSPGQFLYADEDGILLADRNLLE